MILLLVMSLATYAAMTQPVDPARLSVFEDELRALGDRLLIPGMAAGIRAGGEVVWAAGFGYADRENRIPVTPDTPFHLASLTKTFASTLILSLVQDGRIGLDDPVGRYGVTVDSRHEITVRHLLSHTSLGRPGVRYRYSGDRFSLLDGVVSAAAGESFGSLLRRRILLPLQMSNTGWESAQLQTPPALPYRLSEHGEIVPGQYRDHFSCAAGLLSSVSDMMRYDAALDEHRFLTPSIQEQAWSPTLSTRGRPLPYGLGWFVQEWQGYHLAWHYGWWDSVSSLYVKVLDRDLSLVILSNVDHLSRGFELHRGDVTRSPAGKLFLDTFLVY
jgi:CubicO group peptidase (beta-lactamase class C family)